MARRKNPAAPCPVMSRVSEQAYEQLGALALREARSISEVIRMLLEDRLQEHPVTDTERAAFRRRRLDVMQTLGGAR